MAIATTLRDFLDSNHLPYEAMQHPRTQTSQATASAVRQPGDKVAKSLLLKDDDRYLLAVLPASRRLHFGQLHRALNRHVGLATEAEIARVFKDCSIGAVPPAGLLYDIDTVVDDALLEQPDIYFEAGDHEELIHMKQEDFRKLLGDATHAQFSHHA
jgi:Ala-tRNA(Pro) deacylase